MLPFDAHVWLLTDPVTRVGTSRLADVPMLPWPRLPELGRLRYLTLVNRWTELITAGTTAGLLHETTGGDLAQSRMWRDVQRDTVHDHIKAILAKTGAPTRQLLMSRITGSA
ncbi:MAG: hypothetical protein ACRDWY_10465 [Actinomycetes bacterium]